MTTMTTLGVTATLLDSTFTDTGAPNAQLTPFVIPSGCPEWQNVISFDPTSSYLQIKPTDVRSHCMPNLKDPDVTVDPFAPTSTWDGTFEFEPGVCPSDWTAYNMATTSTTMTENGFQTVTNQFSSAFCCPRDFTAVPDDSNGGTSACRRSFPTSGPGAHISHPFCDENGCYTPTFTFGDIVQPAWHIKWNTDFQSILQPPMPSITGAETIATWIPPVWTPPTTTASSTSSSSARHSSTSVGGPGYPSHTPNNIPTCEEPGYGGCNDIINTNPSLFFFLTIGLPIIIGVALIGCCIWRCVVSKRVSRDRKRIMAEQRAIRESGLEIELRGSERERDDDAPPMYSQDALVVQPPAYTPPDIPRRN